MPTTVTKIIAADGTGDYTTISSWWTAVKGNIVASDQIHYGQIKGKLSNTTSTNLFTAVFDDATTDSSHYYTLMRYPGEEPKGDFSKHEWAVSSNNSSQSYVIICEVSYFVFQDLYIRDCTTFSTANECGIFDLGGSANITIQRCMIDNVRRDQTQTTNKQFYGIKTGSKTIFVGGFPASRGTSNATIRNNIITNMYHRQPGTGAATRTYECTGIIYVGTSPASSNLNWHSNTITNLTCIGSANNTNATTRGISSAQLGASGATSRFKNNVVLQLTATKSGTGTATSSCFFKTAGTQSDSNQDYNVSDDTTATSFGSHSIASVTDTNQFQKITDPPRLIPQDLIGNLFRTGTNMSLDSSSVTDDITGKTRGAFFDIGAWQVPQLVRCEGKTYMQQADAEYASAPTIYIHKS